MAAVHYTGESGQLAEVARLIELPQAADGVGHG
jgi:hypothetical protein